MTTKIKRRLVGLLEGIPLAMLAVDHEARTVGANRQAEGLFGTQLLDRPFVTVVRHPTVVQAVEWVLDPEHNEAPAIDPFLSESSERVVSMRCILAADGRNVPAEVTVSPMPPVIGQGALIAIVDQSIADEAKHMRRDFVANVSHELKTPLTAMMGFIETLRGPARNDAAARDRFLDIMEREANRMNRLVHDLLSLSRVQSEGRRRPSDDVELPLLLQGVLATLQPAAIAAGVKLESTGLESRLKLPGDPDQLIQVFQNLIENAIKYGGSGGVIRLSLSRIEYEPLLRGPGWAVCVEDFGEGIEEMHLPRLTERFYRIDAHRSRDRGGTGLGLAIVKHIINRHRGRLRIESSRGKGSRFTVILPETLRRS